MERQVAVVLSPDAVADLRDARARYSGVSADLADTFVESFEQVIERLTLFPRSGTPVDGFDDLRRARMRRFPYGVFYRLSSPDGLRVLRVLHDGRDRPTALP